MIILAKGNIKQPGNLLLGICQKGGRKLDVLQFQQLYLNKQDYRHLQMLPACADVAGLKTYRENSDEALQL